MSNKPVPVERPAGQDIKLYRAFKYLIENGEQLSSEQLAQLHYESWHQAYVKANNIQMAIVPE